jgi:hypothetical protein
MDPSILKLIIDEFNQRFDEMEARWDLCFSPPPTKEPRVAVEELRVGTTTSTPSVASAPSAAPPPPPPTSLAPCPAAVRAKCPLACIYTAAGGSFAECPMHSAKRVLH